MISGSGRVGVELTVLGSATPYPRPGNPCSGYLVSAGENRVWVDAGAGTLAELLRHARLERLTAIVVSHAHADHSADLLVAYYAARYADIRLPAPIPLYGPAGLADRIAAYLTNGPVRSPVETVFEVHELSDGYTARLGGLELTAAAVAHAIPAFAVRLYHAGEPSAGEPSGGVSLVYSGDTAPCPALTELARDCDALLCEAGYASPEADPVHHTPEDAGETAAAAGARRLIVTHVGDGTTPEDAVARAATRFAGPVGYAAPGATFVLP